MKIFLRVLFTYFFFISLLLVQSKAQTILFCEGVDKEGKAVNSANSFTIAPNGGYLYFLVQLGYEIDKDEIYYEIYKVDSKGKETYENTIYQELDPKDFFFHKKIPFYDSGKFNVYVYTGDGIYLTSGSLSISKK
ncbi:MAG: hypothetical protein KJ666_12845 [Bacteroidetes bacterium]|nr:hypothetical protein [Bacteroidota bacterium]